MGRISSYPPEFRAEAVRLVLHTDRTMVQIALDLGMPVKTLANWVRVARAGAARDALPGAIGESERDELRRLRRENHELKLEREILRKAAAYFARETTR